MPLRWFLRYGVSPHSWGRRTSINARARPVLPTTTVFFDVAFFDHTVPI